MSQCYNRLLMPIPERQNIPEWAKQERGRDLTWIQENLHILWPAAQHGFINFGRGAIVIDTTSRPTGEGNPFIYSTKKEVENIEDPDALRMVTQYDPTWELVTMLLKRAGRVSTYRVGLPNQKK